MLYDYEIFEFLLDCTEIHDVDRMYDSNLDEDEGDLSKILPKEMKNNFQHGINTLRNLYKTYAKTFFDINSLSNQSTEQNIKELFRAVSYIKFLYFWYDLNNSENSLPHKVHNMAFDDFFVNQVRREERIEKNILRLHSKFLKDWQLEILKDIKVYIIKNKKIEKFNTFKFLKKYTDIQGSILYDDFWDSLSKTLDERFFDTFEYGVHKVLYGICSINRNFRNDEFDTKKYSEIENLPEERDFYNVNIEEDLSDYDFDTNVNTASTTYDDEIDLVYGTKNSENYSYFYILPNYSYHNFPQEKIAKSLTVLSKANFEFQQTDSDDLFYSILQAILYKIYDRSDNVLNFKNTSLSIAKEQLPPKIKRLNEKSFEEFLNNEDFHKIFLLPKEEKPTDNEDSENFLLCFLEKEDISNISGFLVNQTTFLKKLLGPYSYEFEEKNLSFIYEEYLEKLKQKMNSNKITDELEILIVPSLKNIEKDSFNYFSNFKKENFLEELSSIKMYFLDISSDIPSLKIENFDKTKKNNEIFFYPLKNRKIDLYLPYSFEKDKLLNFYEEVKKEQGFFGTLIKKNHLKVFSEPKIIETNLSEFLNITKGFGLKNRKIVTIKC